VAELPDLVEVGREFEDRGGKVLGISQDLFQPGKTAAGELPVVQKFLADRELPLRVFLFDAPNLDGLNEHFDLPGPIPVTLALDAQGREVARHEGRASLEALRAMLRKALGLPPG
jgi:hypothetical protein